MVDPVSQFQNHHHHNNNHHRRSSSRHPPPYPTSPSIHPSPIQSSFSNQSSPSPTPAASTSMQHASASTSSSGAFSSNTDSLPSYDSVPSSSSPSARRRSSQSDLSTSVSTRSSVSTAPTTPGLPSRTWRPTTHVPVNIANRHRHRPTRSGDAADVEERNRWLSEDEGIGGVSTSIGRRRRRRSSGEDDHSSPPPPPSDPSTHPPPQSLPEGSNKEPQRLRPPDRSDIPTSHAGPSTPSSRFVDKQALLATGTSKTERPKARRARSFEPLRTVDPPVNSAARDVTVGVQPPRIQDIVPEPGSPIQMFGLGISHAANVAQSGVETISGFGDIPDYASGRGGDGIGGVGLPLPAGSEGPGGVPSRQSARKDLLGKMYRILGCVLCPTEQGRSPLLHHPITLPCGHTLSSQHIAIPAPAPFRIDPSLPAHEIFALQQRQHQLRLNLWAGVMCPIPTCKRYSPHVSSVPVVDSTSGTPAGDSALTSPGTHRSETLASGVTYYPPPLPPPPAYSAEAPVTENGSPLLDISVDKILHLVAGEMTRVDIEADDRLKPRDTSEVETDESEGEEEAGKGHPTLSKLTTDFSHLNDGAPLAGPSSPLVRQSSKRQKNHLRDRQQQRTDDGSSIATQDWPFKKELLSVVECDVCAMMLIDPVTTPCQHSFCSKCLSRSLDHSSRCPLCRQDLPSFAFFQDHAVNRVLLATIKTAFPEEFAERCASIEREERDSRLDTPIFVCTLAFPGMPTILHVFEPRYRLMIRRCIESSSPRFGMVLPARGTQEAGGGGLQGVMEYGTMLEIQSVQMLPDGRSMVETVGAYRFKLLEKGNLDGYTVGRIERIDDISPEEDAQLVESAMRAAALRGGQSSTTSTSTLMTSAASLFAPQGQPMPGGMPTIIPGPMPADDDLQTTEDYMNICRSFIEQLRSGSAPWLLQRLNNTYGTMPTDPSEFSYWMALVMPIDEYEKARLLPIRSPRLRLKLIVHWVESLRSSWWFSSGCVVG